MKYDRQATQASLHLTTPKLSLHTWNHSSEGKNNYLWVIYIGWTCNIFIEGMQIQLFGWSDDYLIDTIIAATPCVGFPRIWIMST